MFVAQSTSVELDREHNRVFAYRLSDHQANIVHNFTG